MPIEQFSSQFGQLYNRYNNDVKLLIGAVEAKTESFPIQIWNEIRAFNDHIARCYLPEATDAFIAAQIKSADGHLLRIILDCYKVLNIAMHRKYVSWFKITHFFVRLESVNDGRFLVEYERLVYVAGNYKKEAKVIESKNKDLALEKFDLAYQTYNELEIHIQKNQHGLARASSNLLKQMVKSIVIFLAGGFALGLIRTEWYTGHISELFSLLLECIKS